MKRLVYVLCTCAALFCISCQKQEVKPSLGENILQIAPVVGDFTKATDTAFEVGDEIALSATCGDEAWFENVKFTLTEQGWTSEEEIKWYEDATKGASFTAVYPYALAGSEVITVASDQSTHAAVSACDLIEGGATVTSPSEGPVVEIAMNHSLAKVRLTIDNKSGAAIKDVWVANVYGQMKDGVATGNPAMVKACALGGGKYEAIIVPQTTSPKVFVETNNGTAFECVVLEPVTFTKGHARVASVTINPDHAQVVFDATEQGWNSNADDNFSTQFTIEVANITATSAAITVAAASSSRWFFWDVVSAPVLERMTVEAYAKADIEEYLELCADYEVTLEEAELIFKGVPNTYEYTTLKPESDYVVFACYCTEEGTITSVVETASFSTPEAEKIDFTAEISWDNDSALMTVTPSVMDQTYICLYATPEDLSYYDSTQEYLEEMIALYDAFGLMDYVTFIGVNEEELDFDYLAEGTNYALIAAVAGSVIVSDITEKTFEVTVPEPEGYSTLTGDVNLAEVFTAVSPISKHNYGDYYETGAENWDVKILTEDGSKMIWLDVNAEASSDDIVGEYTLAETCAPGTIVIGAVSSTGNVSPSFYAALTADGYLDIDEPMCTFASGSIKITLASGNYLVDLNVLDCLGNKVTGVISVPAEAAAVASVDAAKTHSAKTLSVKRTRPHLTAKDAPKVTTYKKIK